MNATCYRVAIIQHLFSFLMGEASPKNRLNPTSIQGIIQDEAVFRMVMIQWRLSGINVVEIVVFGDKQENIHTMDWWC